MTLTKDGNNQTETKKYSLPFKFGRPAGNGWMRIVESDNLIKMSKNIVIDDHERRDHAIPSPVAHIINFCNRLKGERDEQGKQVVNEQITNEWRGMLAVLALYDNYGLNLELDFIDLTTNLGRVILEGLKESCSLDSSKEYESIPVFKKDGHAFAFVLPNYAICPFKTYPKDLFLGLNWYEYDKNTKNYIWKDPAKVLMTAQGQMTVLSKKLYLWVKYLRESLEIINIPKEIEEEKESAKEIIELYESYENNLHIDDELTEADKKNYELKESPFDLENPKEEIIKDFKVEALLKLAPKPEGAPRANEVFSKKMLIFFPKDSRLVDNYDAFPFSFLDTKSNLAGSLTGKDFKSLIIPPLSLNLAKIFQKNKNIKIKQIIYDDQEMKAFFGKGDYKGDINLTCSVSLEFDKEDQTITYIKQFRKNDIFWTDQLPYMMMWPNVHLPEDLWRSYYFGIYAQDKSSLNIKEYKKAGFILDENAVIKSEQFNITPITRWSQDESQDESEKKYYKGYRIVSYYNTIRPTENVKYKMFHSASIYDYIVLSYTQAGNDYDLGFLVIDHSVNGKSLTYTKEEKSFEKEIKYVIGVDFGTTSTNVFIKPEGALRVDETVSMSSPGKYLLELIKTDVDSETKHERQLKDKEKLENYFLTYKQDLLEKIFTAGILFTAEKLNLETGEIESNKEEELEYVSGKFMLIDNEDFWSGSTEKSFEESQIYFRLKFPDDQEGDKTLKPTAKLFIQSLLQSALLECRMNGATNVSIHYAYPFPHDHIIDTWTKAIESVSERFQVSAIEKRVISEYRFPESFAAELYFRDAAHMEKTRPAKEDGYAIVDIGGGTSDIYISKDFDEKIEDNAKNSICSQHSYKYAGQQLVNGTIIQTIKDDQRLKEHMNLDSRQGKIYNRMRKYLNDIKRPIYSGPLNSSLWGAISILDIMLENGCVKRSISHKVDDFRVFLKIKYMALFYLLANHIKSVDNHLSISRNREQSLFDKSRFSILLAGCGSKGLQYCIGENDINRLAESSFGRSLNKIMNMIFVVPKEFIIQIFPPTNRNKEEVVIGLTVANPLKDLPINVDKLDANNMDQSELLKKAREFDDALSDLKVLKSTYSQFIDLLANSADEVGVKDELALFSLDSVAVETLFRENNTIIKNIVKASNPDLQTINNYYCVLFLEHLIDRYLDNKKAFR
jgi:hypothetical protein